MEAWNSSEDRFRWAAFLIMLILMLFVSLSPNIWISWSLEDWRAFALKPKCEPWTSSLASVHQSIRGSCHFMVGPCPCVCALLLWLSLLLNNTLPCWWSWLLWLFFNDVYAPWETGQTLNLVNYVYDGVIGESLWCNKRSDRVGSSWVNAGLSHCLFSSRSLYSLGSERSAWRYPDFYSIIKFVCFFYKKEPTWTRFKPTVTTWPHPMRRVNSASPRLADGSFAALWTLLFRKSFKLWRMNILKWWSVLWHGI